MKNYLYCLLLPWFLLGQLFTAHADEFECGATWEPQIAFSASSLKINSDGSASADPDHLQNWLRTNLPNTESGSVVIGNVRYVSGNKNTLVYARVLLTENVELNGKLQISLQISRLSSSGTGVNIFQKVLTASSIDEIDQFKAPMQQIINTMQVFLAHELMPTKIKYKIKTGKVQRRPESPKLEIEFIEVHDKFGPIGLDGEGQKLYCFSTQISGTTFEYDSPYVAKSEQETLNKIFKLDITKEIFDASCFRENFACKRPTAKLRSKVTKIFGVPLVSNLEQIESEKEIVTIACPVKIEIDPLQYIFSGEEKPITLKATDYNNNPIYGLWIDDMETTPSSLGTLNINKDMSREDGRIKLTKFKAANTDNEITGEFRGQVCSDTPDDMLGLDENNHPVKWSIKISQKIIVTGLPKIELDVFSEQKLNKLNDLKLTRHDEEKQEYSSLVTDETLHLKVIAPFNKRIFHPNYKDESGFIGKLIEYTGEGEALITAKNPKASMALAFTRGWFDTQDCGRQTFDYRAQEISHNFIFPSAPIAVYVYYRHYIPATNSPVKNHPMEGFSYLEKNAMNAAIKYRQEGYTQDHEFDSDSCELVINKNLIPSFTVPMMLTHYFPMPMLTYFDDSYGFEEVTVPLKEDYMANLLRKVKADGISFDSLQIEKQISLGRSDVALDWEIPEDTDEEKYAPELNVLNGKFILRSSAKILRGKFNLAEK